MDSFIDRLAHRFTAQEIIKANATAEAEELKRTREQVRQYETCLEEMKTVNESMKETLSKLETAMSTDMAAADNGKLSAEDLEEINDMLDDVMAAVQKSKEESSEQQGKLIELLQGLQDATYGQYGQVATYEQVATQQEALETLQNTQSAMLEQLNERLASVESNVSGQMDERIQGMESNVFAQMDERIQGIENNIFGQLTEQMQSMQGNVAAQLQEMGSKISGQTQDIQTICEVQGKIPNQLFSQLQSVQDKLIAQMKTERALAESEKESNNMFSDIQVAVMKELCASQAEGNKEHLGTKFSEQKEQLSDFVHKESVKVYRNVQAVVVDESNKQSEYISQMLNKVTAKNQLLLRLVIGACACSGVSLVAVLVMLLHSFGIL